MSGGLSMRIMSRNMAHNSHSPEQVACGYFRPRPPIGPFRTFQCLSTVGGNITFWSPVTSTCSGATTKTGASIDRSRFVGVCVARIDAIRLVCIRPGAFPCYQCPLETHRRIGGRAIAGDAHAGCGPWTEEGSQRAHRQGLNFPGVLVDGTNSGCAPAFLVET